jgi:hypothetical protein
MYSLFNGIVSTPDYATSNNWIIVNDDIGTKWGEAVVAYCKVISRNLSGGAEEPAKTAEGQYCGNRLVRNWTCCR